MKTKPQCQRADQRSLGNCLEMGGDKKDCQGAQGILWR